MGNTANNNDPANFSKLDFNTIKNERWFVEDPVQKDMYSPFPINISFSIENLFRLKHNNYTLGPNKGSVSLNFQNNDFKYIDGENSRKQPLKKLKIAVDPNKSKQEYKIKSNRLTYDANLEEILNIKDFKLAYSSNMGICPLNNIFDKCEISKSDKFMNKFLRHSIFIERENIKYLKEQYSQIITEQIKKFRELEGKRYFDFEILKKILIHNFSSIKGGELDFLPYIKIYLNNLTENNFNVSIISMFNECGPLLNKVKRVMMRISSDINKDFILYYLCLTLALSECHKPNIIYTYTKSDANFNVGSHYFVNDLILGSAQEYNHYDEKLTLITIKYKEFNMIPNKYPFLCNKPYDYSQFINLYNEYEVFIPKNTILKCTMIKYDSIEFEVVNDILSDQLRFMNVKEKRDFYIYDDITKLSGANLTKFNSEKYIFSNIKYVKLTNKSLLLANKFKSYPCTLESVDGFCLVSNKGDIDTLMSIMNKDCCRLKYLNLSGNEINENALKNFNKGLEAMANTLEYLNLGFNLINDQAIKYIDFSLLRYLRYFILKENMITPEGVKYISDNLKFLSKLIVLDLSCNQKIKGKGLIELSNGIDNLTFLEKLELYQCDLDDDSLLVFYSKIIEIKSLRWINLKFNNIGKSKNIVNETIKLVKELINLEYFNLEQSHFSDTVIKEIKRILSGTEVHNTPTLGEGEADGDNEALNTINFRGSLNLNRNSVNINKSIIENGNPIISSEGHDNALFDKLNELKKLSSDNGIVYHENIFSNSRNTWYKKNIKNKKIIKKLENVNKLNVVYDISLDEKIMPNFILKYYKNLICLNLEGCHNIDESIFNAIFGNLLNFENLKELNLNNTGLAHKINCVKENMNKFCKIEKLYLEFNEIDEFFFIELAEFFFYFVSIKHLDFYGNNINDNSIMIFCNSLNNPTKIEYLNFGKNLICFNGIIYLYKTYQYLNSLTYLDLSYNLIDDQAMKTIFLSLKFLLNLEVFDMRKNKLSDKSRMDIINSGVPKGFKL